MKKLLVYLNDYVLYSILGPLFKFLEAAFELFVPLIVAEIIDKGIAFGDRDYIARRCLILVLLSVTGLVSSITAQYFAAKTAVGFAKNVRSALLRHIQTLSYTELDTLGTSTLMTRMTSDMNQVQTGVNLTLRLLLRSPFVIAGATFMAFRINFKAALIFVAAIPVLSLIVFFIMLRCIPLYKKVQLKLDRVMGLTKENLAGVRVIRAFGHEDGETAEFKNRTAELSQTQLFVGRISALMNPMTYVIINLAVIALIHIGAVKVNAGLLTQGAVVALYNYMSHILIELIKLANLFINVNKSIACGNRISAVFDIAPSINSPAQVKSGCPHSGEVEFRNVSFSYAGSSTPSLTGVNFKALQGETIGIIGGTGSGKSSLVNLIPRFYDASEGEVLVGGVNVKDYPVKELREKIGVVPQQALLFKGTIRDNMLWGNPHASDEDIMHALELAQGLNVVSEKEGGLDYIIEQGGRNLSGGQRQRLTIARALVRKPDILILDDSASALDYATDSALRSAVRGLSGLTVFVVSQRASSIMYADRIIVLEDSQVAGSGTSAELLESCEIYKEIYYTQFEKGGMAQ